LHFTHIPLWDVCNNYLFTKRGWKLTWVCWTRKSEERSWVGGNKRERERERERNIARARLPGIAKEAQESNGFMGRCF
jgi:hypothetical protein